MRTVAKTVLAGGAREARPCACVERIGRLRTILPTSSWTIVPGFFIAIPEKADVKEHDWHRPAGQWNVEICCVCRLERRRQREGFPYEYRRPNEANATSWFWMAMAKDPECVPPPA